MTEKAQAELLEDVLLALRGITEPSGSRDL